MAIIGELNCLLWGNASPSTALENDNYLGQKTNKFTGGFGLWSYLNGFLSYSLGNSVLD